MRKVHSATFRARGMGCECVCSRGGSLIDKPDATRVCLHSIFSGTYIKYDYNTSFNKTNTILILGRTALKIHLTAETDVSSLEDTAINQNIS